jgi:eukaryotic translation initiation factor 2C
VTFTVTLPPNPDAPPKRREPKDFKLTLRQVNEIELAELGAFVNGKSQISSNVITSIQVLDILFRQLAARNNVVRDVPKPGSQLLSLVYYISFNVKPFS